MYKVMRKVSRIIRCSHWLQVTIAFTLLGLVGLNLYTLHTVLDVTRPRTRTNALPSDESQEIYKRSRSASSSLSENMKISKIVHLSWKDEKIPEDTVKWVKRWSDTNPTYEVWFWTDHSAREFVKRKYTRLLTVYDSYRTGIFRADAIRYILLYEFGGIWADLDVEPLKSLEPVREKYASILSQEAEVHARLSWHIPMMACNAFMASRRSHPFFKFVLEMLEINSKESHVVFATGPRMLTRMYYAYNDLYEQLGNDRREDRVQVSPINMFLPTIDIIAYRNLVKKCSDESIGKENQFLCDKYTHPNYKNGPDESSFTDHHWWHSWLGRKQYRKYIPIDEIIPNVIFPEKAGKF